MIDQTTDPKAGGHLLSPHMLHGPTWLCHTTGYSNQEDTKNEIFKSTYEELTGNCKIPVLKLSQKRQEAMMKLGKIMIHCSPSYWMENFFAWSISTLFIATSIFYYSDHWTVVVKCPVTEFTYYREMAMTVVCKFYIL